MTYSKICGIKNLDSALTVQNHGADYIGFVFHKESKRYINPNEAHIIITKLKQHPSSLIKCVGLFVNSTAHAIDKIVEQCDLDILQLCGDESPEFCSGLAIPVLKVIHVSPRSRVQDLVIQFELYKNHVNNIILDNGNPSERGGTGKSFDWSIASELSAKGYKFFLAGGLNYENIEKAISSIHPYGIDISSGVETDGVKDTTKITNVLKLIK
jgi:phosphoribosylanthranilate isomerase